jgi:hypothetical protein
MHLGKESIAKIERLAFDAQRSRTAVDLGPIRTALVKACAELGIDARRPGPPASGFLLDAIAERLELAGWRKARVEYEARVAAAEADVAASDRAREELVELELASSRARAAAVDAGETPPVPSDREADAVSRLRGRIHLLGSSSAMWARAGSWPELARAAVTADEWPGVLMVGGAFCSRLIEAVEATEKYDARLHGLNLATQRQWNQLRAYAVHGAGCRDHPEQAAACEAIGWAWAECWPLQRPAPRDRSAELAAEAAGAA